MIQRRTLALLPAAAAALLASGLPIAGLAQSKKDTLVLAMALEPPGLDPTAGAASAIAEIVLYNVFETLTKIGPDGKVTPLLGRELGSLARPEDRDLQAAQGREVPERRAVQRADGEVLVRARRRREEHEQGQAAVPEHGLHRHARPDHGRDRHEDDRARPAVPARPGHGHHGRAQEQRRPTRRSRSAPGRSGSRTGPRARRSRWCAGRGTATRRRSSSPR